MRDWPRYARALDLRLAGATFQEIGIELEVSRERARQIVKLAAEQLAYRVFRGVRRPLPIQPWLEKARHELGPRDPRRDWLFIGTKK